MVKSDLEQHFALGGDGPPFQREGEFVALIERAVLPQLFADPNRTSLRAWVPCAGSGEQAYWLAILLADHVDSHALGCDLRVFGSDADHGLLERARTGEFSLSIERVLSREPQRRYFLAQADGYRVARRIRDCVLFSIHRLREDPPFAHLDLVDGSRALAECAPEDVSELLQTFHYALVPGGYLLLGSGEYPRGVSEFFTPVEDESGLFRSRAVPPPRLPPLQRRRVYHSGFYPAAGNHAQRALRDAARERSGRMLLSEYCPVCIVIDEQEQVLCTFGNVERFLHNPEGLPSRQLFRVLRPELEDLVANLLGEVPHTGYAPSAHEVEIDGVRSMLWLELRRLETDLPGSVMRAILLKDGRHLPGIEAALASTGKGRGAREAAEQEALQAELRASNQELLDFNQELRSLNEELQSTNEELSLAQAYQQAMNEELACVNDDLRGQLIESERVRNELLSLFENTRIAIVRLDSELRVRSFTRQARQLFSLIDTDSGRPLSDVAAHFSYDDLSRDARHVMRSRNVKEAQVRVAPERWFWLRILPSFTNADEVDGVVLTFVDVTLLKLAELEIARLSAGLSTQVRWLRSVVNLAPVGIGVCSAGRVRVNQTAAEILGFERRYSPEPDLLGFEWASRDGVSAQSEQVREAMTSVGNEPMVELEVEAAGEPRHLLLRRAPLRDEVGRPSGTICALLDVTESKRDDEKLAERRQSLITKLALAVLDGAHVSSVVEQSLIAVRDGAPADFVEFVPNAEVGGERARLGFSKSDGESAESADTGVSIEIASGAKSLGQLCSYRRSARPFSSAALSFLHDVAQVLSRALEQTTLDAGQRQRLASLGALTAGVAHELNTPLQTIALSAAYAQTLDDEERKTHEFERIHAVAQRCGRMVENVLRLARDEALETSPASLNPIIRHAAELAQSDGSAKNLRVFFELTEQEPWLDCNPTELEQVFVNLLRNAAQANPDGCDVHLRSTLEGARVKLLIADNGSGIAGDNADHVFEPFFSTRHGAGGTGLGLALCKRIVGSHGGEIRLLRGEERGAQFEIELPLVEPRAGEPSQA